MLIVFSLLFYACGDISFLWLVVASALVNFVLGRGIDKFRDKAPAKAFLALGLVLNLGTLVGFKYTGFFIENLNNWFSLSIPVPDLPLPLGISFFTFRTVSYLIDCAWGKVKSERNFFTFLLYVSFFPITISGPIARYETMQADLHQRRISADDISIGFGRIAVGLAKKIMLADRLSGIVDQFLGNDFTHRPPWACGTALCCMPCKCTLTFPAIRIWQSVLHAFSDSTWTKTSATRSCARIYGVLAAVAYFLGTFSGIICCMCRCSESAGRSAVCSWSGSAPDSGTAQAGTTSSGAFITGCSSCWKWASAKRA
ncbi:MAG: hypothetical protein ACLT3Y_05805 [Ruminococcus callidus]